MTGNFKLFYHLIQTLGDVHACVWEKFQEESTRFANFPLPHILRHLQLDIEHLTAENITLRDEITNCFSTEMIQRSE